MIGTILILLISVLGISAVMAWGAPTVQKIQDRNALVAMSQEFEDVRHNTLRLTVADSSYFPTVVVSEGDLGYREGTRIMVTVAIEDPDESDQVCDFAVYGFTEAGADSVSYDADCDKNGGDPDFNFEAWRVNGASVTRVMNDEAESAGTGKTSSTNSSLDFSQGDWMFQITNATGSGTERSYAEAWLISTEQIRWDLTSSQREMAVITEGGMIFSLLDDTYFLERFASIQEDAFGNDDTVARIPVYSSSGITTASGRGGYSVFLGLEGNHLRNSTDAVAQVRYTFAGELAESWCNSFIDRNLDLDENRYTEVAVHDGHALGATTCATGDAAGLRAVKYSSPSGDTFPYEFIHAIVSTTISV